MFQAPKVVWIFQECMRWIAWIIVKVLDSIVMSGSSFPASERVVYRLFHRGSHVLAIPFQTKCSHSTRSNLIHGLARHCSRGSRSTSELLLSPSLQLTLLVNLESWQWRHRVKGHQCVFSRRDEFESEGVASSKQRRNLQFLLTGTVRQPCARGSFINQQSFMLLYMITDVRIWSRFRFVILSFRAGFYSRKSSSRPGVA